MTDVAKQSSMANNSGTPDSKIQALLTGALPAPNEFVGYLVQQFQEARQLHEQTTVSLRQLSQQVEETRAKRYALEGAIQKYVADVQHWFVKADPHSKH